MTGSRGTQVPQAELETFRQKVRDWLGGQSFPKVPNDVDERHDILRRWQRTLYQAGWLGVDWPVEDGGRGLTVLHQAAVMQELILAEAPLPPAVVNLVVAGPTIAGFGTAEQKRRYLPPLLAADELWCQGFSEPDAGSDLASLRASASLEGDEFVVTGQKVWTSYAHRADHCLLLVRTDPDAPPHKGISCLIVDMNAPGVTVRPIKQLTGDAEFNEVFFDEVRVPKSNLLGPQNEGWRVAMLSLGNERSRILLQRHTSAEMALRTIIRSIREWRAKTGREVSSEILRRIGHCRVQLRALEAQTRRTVERLQLGVPASALDSLDKLVLTEVEQAVHTLGMDLLGPFRLAGGQPYGLDTERWQHDYFYARSWTVSGGTLQIQRNIVAERLLGLPRM
jgi:alkylation response protein AidB-like acyl-CoA dehydrogenase